MADQPDPPEEWRVYKSDPTPDPEPEQAQAPPTPYSPPPQVPYGSGSTSALSYTPVQTVRSTAPKLVIIAILVAVLGVGIAAAVAIFAAVDGGIGGIGGIDAKDPDDFAGLIDKLEDDKGTTKVQQVGFYTDYMIVYLPYTDDPTDNRQISYTWRGGDLDEWTRGTSDDPVFDLKDIDTDVIDGLCDPVLKMADGATPDDCYIFLAKPSDGDKTWFRTSASDDFGRSYWINYDVNGVEVDRGHS